MTDTALPQTDAAIAAFAAAVRSHLDDLPADEVDDLVDGLEADLLDQAADSADAFELPDSAAYAAELRAAAGLAPRAERAGRRESRRGRLRGRMGRLRAEALRRWGVVASHPAAIPVIDLAVALRPLWWVLRGWFAFAIVGSGLGVTGWYTGVPDGGAGLALLLALVLVSVQWGRGRWAPYGWLRKVRTWVVVGTALVSPFVLLLAWDVVENVVRQAHQPTSYIEDATPGLAVDGERVRNIFAYDADGNPLEGVQLFDQDGDPLVTVGSRAGAAGYDEYFDCGGGPVPVGLAVAGRGWVWNVYPLQEVEAGYGACLQADGDMALAASAARPFDSVAPVTLPDAVDDPQGDTNATPAPSASPSVVPSIAASQSATADPAPTEAAGKGEPDDAASAKAVASER